MKRAPLAKVKADLNGFVARASDGPIVIMRAGRPVAALYAVADEDDLERLLLANDKEFRDLLERGQRQIDAGPGIPEDEFWRQIEADNASRRRAKKKPPRARKSA